MPRFAFGKRKSTAGIENDLATPSFRVLDRSEVVTERPHGRTFDGGANLSAKTHTLPRTTVSSISLEDNIFAEYKPNYRYVPASSFPVRCDFCVRDLAEAWPEPRIISHKGCQFKFTVSQSWTHNGPASGYGADG